MTVASATSGLSAPVELLEWPGSRSIVSPPCPRSLEVPRNRPMEDLTS